MAGDGVWGADDCVLMSALCRWIYKVVVKFVRG